MQEERLGILDGDVLSPPGPLCASWNLYFGFDLTFRVASTLNSVVVLSSVHS